MKVASSACVGRLNITCHVDTASVKIASAFLEIKASMIRGCGKSIAASGVD